MAGMYAVYHGAEGLRRMSKNIHSLTAALAEGLTQLGYHQLNSIYFDTSTYFSWKCFYGKYKNLC